MEQIPISFEPGLSKRYRSLKAVCAARIYRAGLENVARDVDMAGSNLSTALGDKGRYFDVDKMEEFIEKYQDFEPIFYLIDKFLKEAPIPSKARLLRELETQFMELRRVLQAMDGP